MSRRRLTLPAALVGAVVVAQVGVVAFDPRGGVLEPVPVSASSYFSEAQIEHGRAFRRPQLALTGAIIAVELGLLALLAARPPRGLRSGAFARRRPLLTAAAAGAALSVAVSAAPLPLKVVARERAKDVGLVTQDALGYAGDLVLSWGIGAAFAAVGVAAAVALVRRFPRRWWVGGSVVVVAFGAATVYAGPVVLDPLFNDIRPLPAGELRADVLALAERAEVDVGEVFVMDASRRTTAANAYVGGLGPTKRVVLYDTLVADFPRDQVRLVVAHELAHQHHHDLRNGLLYLALVTPLGLLAVARLTDRLAPAPATGARRGAEVVPALALGVAVLSLAITTVSLQLSRAVEARADTFSLELTDRPRTLVDVQTRLAVRNVSDVDPLPIAHALLSTHPTTLHRLGIAEAFARRSRSP